MSAITPFEIKDRRVDKTGNEMLSSASMMLLLKLALSDGSEVSWSAQLKNFKLLHNISDVDLRPLVQAGWVGQRGGRNGGTTIWITDAGNGLVRSLLVWAKGEAGKGVAE